MYFPFDSWEPEGVEFFDLVRECLQGCRSVVGKCISQFFDDFHCIADFRANFGSDLNSRRGFDILLRQFVIRVIEDLEHSAEGDVWTVDGRYSQLG